MPLKIETHQEDNRSRVMKITGLTEKELDELNSMDYREMISKMVEILDSRNDKQGTCWAQGYGIYQMWIRNGSVFMEVGVSCD